MYSHQHDLNELAVLMELRLAFGPGTRLWAHRSREDLCYDWLGFQGRQIDANLRDFASTPLLPGEKGRFRPESDLSYPTKLSWLF